MRGLFVGQVIASSIQEPSSHFGQFRQFPAVALQFRLLLENDVVEVVKLSLLEGESLFQYDERRNFFWGIFSHGIQRRQEEAGKQGCTDLTERSSNRNNWIRETLVTIAFRRRLLSEAK